MRKSQSEAKPVGDAEPSDDARLAELLARLSAGAREVMKYYIDWYRSGSSWRGQGPRIEIPPEFDKMRKAAVALASHLRRVSIVRAVPNHLKRAHGDRGQFKLVGIDCVVSVLFASELIDADVLPDEQAIQDRLERMLADLDDFANRLMAAQRHGKHRGRKTDRPRHFVNLVASAIEQDKGQRMTRPSSVVLPGSDKKNSLFELLRNIVAVVDPKIGSGTVDEVLKARSKRRGEISRGKR